MGLVDDVKNKAHLKDLKDRIESVVPFLGSGMSLPYGYFTWGGFLRHLLEVANDMMEISDEERANVELHLTNKNYMKAADDLDNLVPNLNDVVCNEIGNIDIANPINEGTKGLLGEYLHLFPSQTYLTTNYDKVAENVLRLYFQDRLKTIIPAHAAPLPASVGLNREQNPVLYYLHGCFESPDSIILSGKHYVNYYGFESGDEKVDMRNFLTRNLFNLYSGRYTFLFLGCGMSVSEDRILTLFRKINGMMKLYDFNYALLNKNEFADLQVAERVLLGLKVRPLWFSANDTSHEDAKRELFEYLLGERRVREAETKSTKDTPAADRPEGENEQLPSPDSADDGALKQKIDAFFDGRDRGGDETGKKLRLPFPMFTVEGRLYEIYLVEEDGDFYVSDNGTTYKELDKIFELKEQDVIKNIDAILRQYRCKRHPNTNAYIISCSKFDFELKYSFLVQAVSFMLNMKIFYV